MHFDRNLFTCSPKGKKDLNDLKFDTFVGRFTIDGAASMAVKGLTVGACGSLLRRADNQTDVAGFQSISVVREMALPLSSVYYCLHVLPPPLLPPPPPPPPPPFVCFLPLLLLLLPVVLPVLVLPAQCLTAYTYLPFLSSILLPTLVLPAQCLTAYTYLPFLSSILLPTLVLPAQKCPQRCL